MVWKITRGRTALFKFRSRWPLTRRPLVIVTGPPVIKTAVFIPLETLFSSCLTPSAFVELAGWARGYLFAVTLPFAWIGTEIAVLPWAGSRGKSSA